MRAISAYPDEHLGGMTVAMTGDRMIRAAAAGAVCMTAWFARS